jgi:hypothetical protein
MKCFTVRVGGWHAPVDPFITRTFDVGHEGKRIRIGAADIDRHSGFTLEHKDETSHVPMHIGLLTDEFASVEGSVITLCRAQLGTAKNLLPEAVAERESKDLLVLVTAGGGYRLPFKSATIAADQQKIVAGGTCEWLLVLKPGDKVECDLETWGFLGAIKASWKKSTFTHCIVENEGGVLKVTHQTGQASR